MKFFGRKLKALRTETPEQMQARVDQMIADGTMPPLDKLVNALTKMRREMFPDSQPTLLEQLYADEQRQRKASDVPAAEKQSVIEACVQAALDGGDSPMSARELLKLLGREYNDCDIAALVLPWHLITFDKTEFKQSPKDYLAEYPALLEGATPARRKQLERGALPNEEELQRWEEARVAYLLAWGDECDAARVYRFKDSTGREAFLLGLSSGGGLSFEFVCVGPFATMDLVEEHVAERGRLVKWQKVR